MSKTISDILQSVNFQHKIPRGHPFLATKLSSIEKPLRPGIFVVIGLFTENLVDLELFCTPDMSEQLSKIFASRAQVQMTELYAKLCIEAESLYAEAKLILKTANTDKPKERSLKSIIEKYPTTNSRHVTYWLSQFPLYVTLMNSLNQAIIPTPFIPAKKSIRFNPKIQVKSFKCHASEKPNSFIKNYTDLEEILINLGVTLPNNLSSELAYLLKIKFEDIAPNLHNGQIAMLTSYALLFLFKRAEFDLNTVNFTYANGQFKVTLNQVMSHIATKLCDNLYEDIKLTFEQLKEYINKKLNTHGLMIQPNQLMIFCFESCPLLKSLMMKHWSARGIDLSIHQSRAFIPHLNPFILGNLLYSNHTKTTVLADNNDLPLLFELVELNKSINKKGSGFFSETVTATSKKQFEETQSQLLNPKLRVLFSLEKINNYTIIPVLNDTFISKFIRSYINPNRPQPTPQGIQDDFLFIFKSYSERVIQIIISDLVDSVNKSHPNYLEYMQAQEKKTKANSSLVNSTFITATTTQKGADWYNAQYTILYSLQLAYAHAINIILSPPQENTEAARNYSGFKIS
ncbi:MAG: hypothetical protein P4L65_08655 [Legionella sp.]|nr:hypothetical protein [Legionella sp.]